MKDKNMNGDIQSAYMIKPCIKKIFGQFLTDPVIANMMVKWAIKNNPKTFLDPAAGPGTFTHIASELNDKLDITAVEFERGMIIAFKNNNHYRVNLVESDYLIYHAGITYDAIVCNPPYNKFQAVADRNKYKANFESQYDLNMNGYTNQYVYFLIKSINELSEKGRCCYLIPFEFMNTGYGLQIKKYLIEKKILKGILKFNSLNSLFSDATTTSCILFMENTNLSGCYFINSNTIDSIDTFDFDTYVAKNDDTYISYDAIDYSIKWSSYFSKEKSKEYTNLVKLDSIGRVKRGIATGSNSFFTLNLSRIKAFNLSKDVCEPCITKSPYIKSCVFDDSAFNKLKEDDKKMYLFNGEKAKTKNDRDYIKYGEQERIDKAFLTSHRKPWYAIERKEVAPIWVSVFSRGGLKIIRNLASIKNLTTFHSLFFNNYADDDINIMFCYLLTPIANTILAENKREYGKGLDKFEPNDLNESRVIDVKCIPNMDRVKILSIYKTICSESKCSTESLAALDSIFTKLIS